MIVKLLTEHHLEFLNLEGGCRGSSESTLVEMSNCWKSHAAAHLVLGFTSVLSMVTHRILYAMHVSVHCLRPWPLSTPKVRGPSIK